MPFVSLSALVENLALTTGVAWYTLVTVQHADLAQPLRLVSPSATSIVSNGNTFLPAAFDAEFGSVGSDEPVQANIRISSVDGTVLDALQGLDPSPTLDIEAVIETELDDVQAGVYGLVIDSLTQEGIESLTLALSSEVLDQMPFPGILMTRDKLRALFTDL